MIKMLESLRYFYEFQRLESSEYSELPEDIHLIFDGLKKLEN